MIVEGGFRFEFGCGDPQILEQPLPSVPLCARHASLIQSVEACVNNFVTDRRPMPEKKTMSDNTYM